MTFRAVWDTIVVKLLGIPYRADRFHVESVFFFAIPSVIILFYCQIWPPFEKFAFQIWKARFILFYYQIRLSILRVIVLLPIHLAQQCPCALGCHKYMTYPCIHCSAEILYFFPVFRFPISTPGTATDNCALCPLTGNALLQVSECPASAFL